MGKSCLNQLRLDSVLIERGILNLESRDRIVPVLRALQHVDPDRKLADQLPGLIAGGINGRARTHTGREGMDDWQLCGLAAVQLGSSLRIYIRPGCRGFPGRNPDPDACNRASQRVEDPAPAGDRRWRAGRSRSADLNRP